MKLALTEPQEDFVFSSNPYPAMVAGLGAGKSEAGIARLVIKMAQQPQINTAYYMPTYDLLRLRAMPGVEDMLSRLGLPFKTNRSEYTIHIKGYGDMIFRSYDRPERIVAYEVADSIVDELDTLPKDKAAYVWRKVSERNRQHCGRANTIGSVTTPDQGYSGFTYEKWVKKRQKGYELIKASTASNPFLPDGYIEQIRANYDPILADMYLNGEFVSLSQNKVYHFFDRIRHHSDRVLTAADTFVHIGLDFNIGGTCATVWVIDNNCPIAVDEFVSHDTMDFCNNLTKYKAEGRKLIVYPDASGKAGSTNASQSDIEIIIQAGYRVDCAEANPAVRDRINSVNGLLAHDKMRVNTDKCPNLTDALESQGYDTKGDPEKFKEHPAIDDWNDSLGYFIYRKWPVRRPSSAGVKMGGRW
jgi:PBSX family phage terminase large subunit